MHITLRRIIFAFFLTIFIVSAPLIVLYTAGYRLNIYNRHLQQTGVLAIATFPRGGNIVFNGQSLAQKTPYVIQRIMPNIHDVTLQKKGYHDWTQRIRVEEGKTSYITARLFAESEPELLDQNATTLALRSKKESVMTVADNASVTFSDNGSNIEVTTGQKPNQTLIALLPQGAYQMLEEDTDYVLITNQNKTAFLIGRQGGEVVELPTPVQNYDWAADENLLLWTDGNEVNILNANTGERTFVTRESQTVFDLAWHPSVDSFFVVIGDTLSAFDASVHENREITNLLVETNISDIWLDVSGKNLYFTQNPVSADLVPSVYKLPLVI